jgi:hypothetical protein
MRLLIAATLVLAVVLAAAPASADAKRWVGETAQGKRVVIRTGADGVVNRVRVHWRAHCNQTGRKIRGGTTFLPPFDSATTRSFLDEGDYRVDVRGPGRIVNFVHVRGNLAANGPWRGVFRIRSEFRRGARTLGTCRLRGVRFTARAV